MPLMPEDSLEDPELGFGDEEELQAEPMAPVVHDTNIAFDDEPRMRDIISMPLALSNSMHRPHATIVVIRNQALE